MSAVDRIVIRRNAALAAAVAAAVLGSGSARAAPGDASGLEEIVVTAQKRTELLRDVPVAITAVSSATLDRMYVQSFADYVTRIPGFNMISSRTGEAQLILRGLTTGADQATATVATYLDEAPIGSSIAHSQSSNLAPDLDPMDLERIEVLRGPQGTLYGVNSLGGLLKYVTRAPELDGFHASGRADLSSVDGGESGGALRGMINVPLVEDQLALRLNGFVRQDPGYMDDDGRGVSDVNSVDADGLRLQMLWKPSDALSIRLSALAQNLRNDGDNLEIVDIDSYQPVYGDLQQRNGSATTIDNEHRAYNLLADWALGSADLVSSTSYSTLDSEQHLDITYAYGELLGGAFGIENLGVTQPFTPRQRKFTQEFRLTSTGERRWDWQVGAVYAHESARYRQGLTLFDTVSGEPIDVGLVIFDALLESQYDEYAAFGNVTYHFTPQFDVIVGGRYSSNDQSYRLTKDGLLVIGSSGTPEVTYDTSSEDDFSFLFAPRYRFSDDFMVYGRIASGYRPGAPNSITVATEDFAPPVYGSDQVVNYEVGFKGSFLDAQLTLDVAAFFIDWSDIQLTGQRQGFRFGANGGTARSEGVELSAIYSPVDGLVISANAAYTDAQLTEDTDPGIYGLDGERLPFVPEFAGNLAVDYDWAFGEQWGAYAGASYHYTGDRLSDIRSEATSHPRVELPAYDQVDLRAGLSFADWTLDFYVKNVADERGVIAVAQATIDDESPLFGAAIIQPRTYGCSLSARF